MAAEDPRIDIGRQDRLSTDDFPDGFRVLVVDDDIVSLKVMEMMLHRCQYEVTLVTEATLALEILRQKKEQFDLVITDVHMPGMDGFELLKHIETEMDIPVIMISADCDYQVVQRGMTQGACDYIKKPPNYDNLSTLWRHVFRRDRKNSQVKNIAGMQSLNAGVVSNHKRKMKINCNTYNEKDEIEYEENTGRNKGTCNKRKSRFVWSSDPHQKFLEAVKQLGVAAIPKAILNFMNANGPVEGLTREIVSGHLQKFRNGSTRLHLNNDTNMNNDTDMNKNALPGNRSGELADDTGFQLNRFPSSLGKLNNSFGFGQKERMSSRIVKLMQEGNIMRYSGRENVLGINDAYNLGTGREYEQHQYLGRTTTSAVLGQNRLMASNMAQNNTCNSIPDLIIHQGAYNLGYRHGNMLHGSGLGQYGRIANTTDNLFPNYVSQTYFPVTLNTIPSNVIDNNLQSAANQKDSPTDYNVGKASCSSMAHFPHVEIENVMQGNSTPCEPMCMLTAVGGNPASLNSFRREREELNQNTTYNTDYILSSSPPSLNLRTTYAIPNSPMSNNGRENQKTDTAISGPISPLEKDSIILPQVTDTNYRMKTSELKCVSSYSGHNLTIPVNSSKSDNAEFDLFFNYNDYIAGD